MDETRKTERGRTVKRLLELRLDGRLGFDTALSARLERVVDRRGAKAVQVNSTVLRMRVSVER